MDTAINIFQHIFAVSFFVLKALTHIINIVLYIRKHIGCEEFLSDPECLEYRQDVSIKYTKMYQQLKYGLSTIHLTYFYASQ